MPDSKIDNSDNVDFHKKDRDVEDNKNIALLSYLWVLFLIPLLIKKDSKFAQFHAKQGLILFILSLVCWFPFFGQLVAIVLTVVYVVGIIKTLNGEWWKIPYVYEYSKMIKL
jgi:uncharacterized membrane protein